MTAITQAEDRLGFELKDFQRAAVDALVSGRDVMMSAPTGAGKTAVYQTACWALAERGVTVVLSPLIALIRDQHRRMKEAGMACECFYSQVPREVRQYGAEMVETGQAEIVLTTPESLGLSDRLREALATVGVALLVVDEGHAYEEWAHSFRPAYRRVGKALESIGVNRVMVCSATLSPLAAAEAAESLGRWDWDVVAAPAARPNLFYQSAAWRTPWDLLTALSNGVIQRAMMPTGIVYTTAARSASNLHAAAARLLPDLPADLYHGKLGARERNEAQERWMQGGRWVFATKAFGMGVDNPNVRTVAHVELPASVGDYAQEAGRAGRDGKPAVCVLNRADSGRIAAFLAEQSNPSLERVRAVHEAYEEACGEQWVQMPAAEIARRTGLRSETVSAARGWLVGADVVDVRPADRSWYLDFDDDASARMAGNAAGRRMLEAYGKLKRAGRATSLGRSCTPDEIAEALAPWYRDWRGAVRRMQDRDVVTVRRESRASWVRVRRPFNEFDPGRLERARDAAVAKLDGIRNFAALPDDLRAPAIEAAVQLDAQAALDEIKWRRDGR